MVAPNMKCKHEKEFIAKRDAVMRSWGAVGGSFYVDGVVYVADIDGVKYIAESSISLFYTLQLAHQRARKLPRKRGFWSDYRNAKAVSFRVIAVIACKQQRRDFVTGVINQMRAFGCDVLRPTQGWKHTDDERRAKRAQRHTAEAKARIAVFRTGKKHSAETCRKISQTRKERGIKPSPAHLEKMRAGRLAKRRKQS